MNILVLISTHSHIVDDNNKAKQIVDMSLVDNFVVFSVEQEATGYWIASFVNAQTKMSCVTRKFKHPICCNKFANGIRYKSTTHDKIMFDSSLYFARETRTLKVRNRS